MDFKIKSSFIVMSVMIVLHCKIALAEDLTRQEIAKKALAATIHLVMFGANDETWTGSGFFVRPNYIATNFHVIDGAVGGLAKRVGQKTVYTIEYFTAKDKGNDLAILQVSAKNVEPLPLGNSDQVEIGDTVYAVGNPKGLEGTFSHGLISAIRDEGEWGTGKRLQYTAPGARGSSGGPMLNGKGEVIGIVVSGYESLQNLNFAIPSNYLNSLAIKYLGSAKPAYPKVNSQKPKPPKAAQQNRPRQKPLHRNLNRQNQCNKNRPRRNPPHRNLNRQNLYNQN